jgi:uncharacterized protein (DUF934 family)
MPLLEHGEPIADRWTEIADDAALPADGQVVVSLARFLDETRNAPFGVRIGAATSAADLAQVAARAAMVVIEFPGTRDGRGFSLARRLRERHGFRGEIRAAGQILPDNYGLMTRCGFSTVLLPEGADLAPWRAALGRFAKAYQVALPAG